MQISVSHCQAIGTQLRHLHRRFWRAIFHFTIQIHTISCTDSCCSFLVVKNQTCALIRHVLRLLKFLELWKTKYDDLDLLLHEQSQFYMMICGLSRFNHSCKCSSIQDLNLAEFLQNFEYLLLYIYPCRKKFRTKALYNCVEALFMGLHTLHF